MKKLSEYPALASLTITGTRGRQTRPALIEDPETGCFEYTGACNVNGYGLIRRGKGNQTIHRLAWTLCFGPIAPGLHVHHKCGTRRCANPEHLEALTLAEHNRRHSWGTLSKADYPAIDALAEDGTLHAEIGKLYGVSRSRITQVVNRGTARIVQSD